mmetsp:Transcript_12142/g.21550  ORF Transcript_12142/g.21550 Transcript_12142/m.21550 type:complete len:80 (-) Transcript_12142:177-416(-)
MLRILTARDGQLPVQAPPGAEAFILAFGGAVRWSTAGTAFLSLAKVFPGKTLGLDSKDELLRSAFRSLSQLAALRGLQI